MTKLKSKELDYQAFLLAKKVIAAKGELDINIVGSSMLPLLPISGYVAKVYPIASLDLLKRFDVIVFWQNNILISHYFWKTNEYFNEDPNDPYLVTRPLNPIQGVDQPIKFENILGIVPAAEINWWLKMRIYKNLLFK